MHIRFSLHNLRGTRQPPLPPQVPQSSIFFPLFGTPSQPVQVALLPPHTPHASTFFPLFGTPSQPAHALPSPPHTPHASNFFPLLGTPSQPAQDKPLPPHTLQSSRTLSETVKFSDAPTVTASLSAKTYWMTTSPGPLGRHSEDGGTDTLQLVIITEPLEVLMGGL
jgi:hypothetical protein